MVNLNEKERELHQMSFAGLNVIEFAKLIKSAQWKKVESGTVLINEHQPMEELLMIYNGQVDILVDNEQKKINELKDGQFIGEMSFLSQQNATATVKTTRPTEYICWKQGDLRNLMTRNPSLLFSMQAAMGIQISEALRSHNKNI